jgi:hypothetical protein
MPFLVAALSMYLTVRAEVGQRQLRTSPGGTSAASSTADAPSRTR